MPPIIAAQGLSKRFGAEPLFQEISFTLSEGERIGLIGPNGSGKSTLLEILRGRVAPDTGEVALRRRTRLASVTQNSEFPLGATIRSVIEAALDRAEVPEKERAARIAEPLGRAGFTDLDVPTAALSGGWRKRLAIVEGLVEAPDVLLLDEPTNHLDLAGIEWLESILLDAPFACVVVSHDRYFLENVATAVVELARSYENGFLRVDGNYSTFLEAKENFLHAQRKRHEALENLVHKEIEWLRRGAKARTSKSKARIDTAQELIGELADLNSRTRANTAQIDFSSTDRQTKRLIALDGVTHELGGRALFANLHFTVTSGMRVGLVGPNGSGKTTLLRLLRGDIEPTRGNITRAPSLRIVYFDQNRALDPEISLRRALAPDSDSVIYQDRVIHVAAWAAKFLFDPENLGQPVGKLSGGERARVLIAQLMLQPADVLLLDEPTNDLDIPTLEILEESLLEYRGALALVTHDRFMLDRVSTVVLGLDGRGGADRFADFSQWDAWQRAQKRESSKPTTSNGRPSSLAQSLTASARRKLSYLEVRELDSIEQRIREADENVEKKRAALEDPSVTSDPPRLRTACVELDEAQSALDQLYARWGELEKKKAGA
ncbi:MAG TPA: ABC-F family ATP-binding cassette domain-containing protein [Verrucomicrobiae bacterium]|jgi:ATP-binding cassette subfamily F protein uup|nr:ABC-F family ATP-binding cassette domain-containing protein [Verrucomicrobiae bacterium]